MEIWLVESTLVAIAVLEPILAVRLTSDLEHDMCLRLDANTVLMNRLLQRPGLRKP